ncbi:Multiple C2 domain and transmembrane region protein [Strongyloides ratti]|uniref:Multiple C2 domain and transmembrane region protein n=1 Tax=Strongyloides ratti TaxID=34506 RepID=A0A090LBH3_STRRB|nr:Multiple C2 domain and transmembrane region protein [Strongyloides ratti]CEF64870.1 Multiple C2 domain and transmembrane region protein [Strongyloides ratti]
MKARIITDSLSSTSSSSCSQSYSPSKNRRIKRKKKHDNFWCLSLPTIDSMQGFEENNQDIFKNTNISRIHIDDCPINNDILEKKNNLNMINLTKVEDYSLESPNHSSIMLPKERFNKKNGNIKKRKWFSTGNLFYTKSNSDVSDNQITSPRMMIKNMKKVFTMSKKSKDMKIGFKKDSNYLYKDNPDTPENIEYIKKYERNSLTNEEEKTKKNERISNNKDEQEVSTFITDEEEIYVTFRLNITLHSGINLAKRDACGSSDPYIKFKYKQKIIYKSCVMYKNLNPFWNEEFSFLIQDPTEDLYVDCYDYDRFMSDDYMGGCVINLAYLTLSQNYDLKLELEDKNNSNPDEELGYVTISIKIEPLTKKEKDIFLDKATRGVLTPIKQPLKTLKYQQIWNAVLNIVLVQANLNPLFLPSNCGKPSPYVKFRLGNEKYKSKVVGQTYEPQWLEQFDLHIYDEENHDLEMSIINKTTNTILGNASIQLNKIIKEQTNEMWIDLFDDKGSILLLISISGSYVTTRSIDKVDEMDTENNEKIEQYKLSKTLDNIFDIGYLTIKVFKAKNLAALDLNGKSDPFVVVELDNSRLQTHTEYKTLNPEWNKLFTFNVKDIHSIIYFTLYDEDPNKKTEFLGKIGIPLLSIKNCSKRWYGLKDEDLRQRVKGEIYLEMDIIWNPIRAAIRTFNPRERKLISKQKKFQKSKLMRDINILKNYYKIITEMSDTITRIFNWENYIKSFVAMIIFIVTVYYIEPYHLPLIIVVILLKNYMYIKVRKSNNFYSNLLNTSNYSLPIGNNFNISGQEFLEQDIDIQENNTSPTGSSGKQKENVVTTWKNTVFSLGDNLVIVQEALHYIVSLIERINNTLNYSVPYISILATISLGVVTIILYFIPIRWIVMLWGINKFTKKLRNPHYIPNNELLDFLSRVPSDIEKEMFSEFAINQHQSDGKK